MKASYEFDKDKKQVLVTLEQTQVDAKSEIPLFHIDFDVKLTDAAGAEFAGKISFDDQGREYNSNEAWAVIKINNELPHRIQIDPNCNRLFSLEFNPGEEMLGNIAAKADDVPSRIRAHRELIKIGTSSSMLKVEQAVLAENYHGVRAYVATALGEARTRLAIDLLCKMLKQDGDPLSTWRIAKSCVGIRDNQLRLVLQQFLKRNDLAYR